MNDCRDELICQLHKELSLTRSFLAHVAAEISKLGEVLPALAERTDQLIEEFNAQPPDEPARNLKYRLIIEVEE